MLTKKDAKLIEEILKINLDAYFKEFSNDQQKKFENKIIQFKDDILTEIKKLREDVIVVTGYKDQIEDHETRITKLESVSSNI